MSVPEDTGETGVEVLRAHRQTNTFVPVVAIGGALLLVVAGIGYALGTRRHEQNQQSDNRAQSLPSVPSLAPTIGQLVTMTDAQVRAAVQAARLHDEAASSIGSQLPQMRADDLQRVLGIIENETGDGVSYGTLERNPEAHKNKLAIYTGEVVEIHDTWAGGRAFLRVWVNPRDPNSIIAVFPYAIPQDSVQRNTRVKVYGIVYRTYTYTSQLHAEITIPRVDAFIVLPDEPKKR